MDREKFTLEFNKNPEGSILKKPKGCGLRDGEALSR